MPTLLQAALGQRPDQIFLKFDMADVERMCGFGDVRSFAAGERLATAGEVAQGLFIILAGKVGVTEHNALGVHQHIVSHGPGNFLGELAQFSGRPAFLLNVISNGFYAATKRKAMSADNGYEATVTAATRNLGDRVEIRIPRQWPWHSPDVKEKMFK